MGAGFAGAFMRSAAAAALVAALVAALATGLASASPAAAHDVLEATEPAAGSTVVSVPPTIRLTFMHTPLALGSRVLIRDETGASQSDGPVAVVDNHVTQTVRAGAPAGRYTVEWRIVSADSHPIEGTFSFTAGAGGGAGQPAALSVQAKPAPAQNPGGTVAPLWGLAAGGAVLAAGLAGTALHVRRRLAVNDADGPES
ncbi:copper resistance protein CopC [Arthrobacter sp. NPDC058130]|uniref:copper resistance CopC family protein n=1 Tax=Arthrobacter sp. NPDC058130 TaxID=3346353 RepID=UPI0036E2D8A6